MTNGGNIGGRSEKISKRQNLATLHLRQPKKTAPQGNQYWRKRKRHGRRLKYSTPAQLEAACEDYFEWVDSHPLLVSSLIVYRGKAKIHQVPKHRPMTRAGLYLHLKIDRHTWRNYRTREDFFPVCERAEMVIDIHLYTLAVTGLSKPSIIAHLLSSKRHF